jgi:hypothetical protein
MGIYDHTIPEELFEKARAIDRNCYAPSDGLLVINNCDPREIGIDYDHKYVVSSKDKYTNMMSPVQECYNIVKDKKCFNVAYRIYPQWSKLCVLVRPRLDSVHYCPKTKT